MPNSSIPHPNSLASKRVLVIGGTSGLGFAIASGALANGSKVHVSSSQSTKVSEAVAHLKSLYPDAVVSGTVGDMSDKETVEANVKAVLDGAVKDLGGPLDHIVYTAGEFPTPVGLTDITASGAFNSWVVRYLGPLMVAKLVASHPGAYLNKQSSSSLTFTSGLGGKRPMPGRSATISVTGGVETLSRSLAVELAPIRSNVVIPGAIKTQLMEGFGETTMALFKERSLVKEIGTPEAAAEAYLYAMRSSFVTAQEIVVDGGMLIA